LAAAGRGRWLPAHGIRFGEPEIDPQALKQWKNKIVGKLTAGLAILAKKRNVTVVRGQARFASPHRVEVKDADGKKRVIGFEQCIVAAGSEPARIPGLPDDPRVMDSTGALDLKDIPGQLLVIGGGIIGLEMACVYDALGSKVTVEDQKSRERESYYLVFGDAVEFEEGHVTMASPIGKSLLGKAVGEVAFLKLPAGMRQLKVVDLKTIHDHVENGG